VIIRWKDLFERLEDAIDSCRRPRTSSRASSSNRPEPVLDRARRAHAMNLVVACDFGT
jgi:hypothetical protein